MSEKSRNSTPSTRRRRLLTGVLGLLAAAALAAPASGLAACTAEVEYTGAENGSWLTAGNWQGGKVPTGAQTVCIPAGKGTIEIAGGTAEAKAVEARSAVHVAGAATLKLTGTTFLETSEFFAAVTVDSGAVLRDDSAPIRMEGATLTVDGEVKGTGAIGNEVSLHRVGEVEAALSGTGTIGINFATAEGSLFPGGDGTIGTLSFIRGFGMSGGKLNFDLAGPGSFDKIVTDGAVVFAGPSVIGHILPAYKPAPAQGTQWPVFESAVKVLFNGSQKLTTLPWELDSTAETGAKLVLVEAAAEGPQPPKLSVAAGDKQATFTVTPTNNGTGSEVQYIVRVEPGGIELAGGQTASGLINCKTYSATAVVKTSVGTSGPSEAVQFTPVGPEGCGGSKGGGTPPPEEVHVPTEPKKIEELALGCSGRQLVLSDVYIHGSRVAIAGSAARSLAGKKVKILFNEKKVVATATVAANGQFTTTAPLPPKRIREALTTRYTATLGKLRSLHLKLTRRLLLEPPKASGASVTLSGIVTPPLTKPVSPVAVEEQLECGKTIIATRFTPPASGRFHITVTLPAGAKAAIFRLTSAVAANRHATAHGFSTFSLPLPVTLG